MANLYTFRAAGRLLALGALILVMGSLTACRGNLSTEPPVHLNQNMDFQQKFEAQEQNDWFRNHQSMRQPMAGTVHRDLNASLTRHTRFGQSVPTRHLRNNAAYFTGLTVPNAMALQGQPKEIKPEMGLNGLPGQLKLTKQFLARGEERYGIFCTPCHGLSGEGDGTVPNRAGPSYNVPSYQGPTTAYPKKDARTYPLGYIFSVITHGNGIMGSYAAQVPVEDRWAIAVWVRTLQVSQALTDAKAPQTNRNATEGK